MERETRQNLEQKYKLTKENIYAQSELPGPERLSEKLKSLGWPLEFQGTGLTLPQTKEFKIYYPKGDIFLSFATTIHELGHLRQDELSPDIAAIDEEKEPEKYLLAKEEDAYKRGWQKAEKYCPETLKALEKKFQKYKKAGKLSNFENFEQLYQWFTELGLKISKIRSQVPEIDDQEEYDAQTYKALKQGGIEQSFKQMAESRVSEIVDEKFIENFIMEAAQQIASE